MIIFDNKEYRPYILFTDSGPVLGLDERALPAVEAEWLQKNRKAAERAAKLTREAIRANIQNEQLAHRKVEHQDPILTEAGVGESGVALGEVAQPPAEIFDADEVLRLNGLPTGYGAVSVLAGEVSGVAAAWGDAADDICAGVPIRRVKPRKGKKS